MKRKLFKFIALALLLMVVTVACKKEPVEDIRLDKTTLMLAVNETVILKATIFPFSATNKTVTWTTSNSNVATVKNNNDPSIRAEGLVTAKAIGTTTITVTTKDGKFTAACTVTVIDPEPELILIKGGTFIMGCTDEDCRSDGREEPAHQVTLHNYKIAKYPVTQKEWMNIMGNNPSTTKGDDLPVHNISWLNAQEYITKLNAITGKNYRLPTEAEWEYAARGGNQSNGYKYSGGDDADLVAWHAGNSNNTIHPVGDKKSNELGIHDMSGNVWEFCSDYYSFYTDLPLDNPTGPTNGTTMVSRGGAFALSPIPYCRVSARAYIEPNLTGITQGFRIAHP